MTPADSSATAVSAAEAWREVLGEDGVREDPGLLDHYARSTMDWSTRARCVLLPRSTEEVQACVRIAAAHGAPLHPISAGRNWGYGDACAPKDGAAIVDLRRMDRIIEINPELAYAVVEPGVRQGALHAALEGTGLWMDATGAGPEASVVGNTLERGFGHTRYGDHVQTVCGMEVVLGNGEILRTGHSAFDDCRTERVYRYGLGPDLQGLMFQSNVGIVTRMGLWLMPKPEAFQFFYLTIAEPQALAGVVDALRRLRLDGLLGSVVHIANDLRLFSGKGRYPWDLAGGATPLPDSVRQSMRRAIDAGAWNLSGSISGPRAVVRGAAKALAKAMKPYGRVRFISPGKLDAFERLAGVLPGKAGAKAREQLAVLRPNFELLRGKPSYETLQGAYWRAKSEPSRETDGRLTDVGLHWVSPVLPMRGEDALRVVGLAEPLFAAHGFEPLMTLSLINDRAMIAVMQIAFDPAIESERASAAALHEALHLRLADAGYRPYRVSPDAMDWHRSADSPHWRTAAAIKQALDPANIITPGRYIPDGPLQPGAASADNPPKTNEDGAC